MNQEKFQSVPVVEEIVPANPEQEESISEKTWIFDSKVDFDRWMRWCTLLKKRIRDGYPVYGSGFDTSVTAEKREAILHQARENNENHHEILEIIRMVNNTLFEEVFCSEFERNQGVKKNQKSSFVPLRDIFFHMENNPVWATADDGTVTIMEKDTAVESGNEFSKTSVACYSPYHGTIRVMVQKVYDEIESICRLGSATDDQKECVKKVAMLHAIFHEEEHAISANTEKSTEERSTYISGFSQHSFEKNGNQDVIFDFFNEGVTELRALYRLDEYLEKNNDTFGRDMLRELARSGYLGRTVEADVAAFIIKYLAEKSAISPPEIMAKIFRWHSRGLNLAHKKIKKLLSKIIKPEFLEEFGKIKSGNEFDSLVQKYYPELIENKIDASGKSYTIKHLSEEKKIAAQSKKNL